MPYDWSYFEEQNYKELQYDIKKWTMGKLDTTEVGEYFYGSVFCGHLSFDITMHADAQDCYAEYYIFVLGVDSGYGYAKDGTPYDMIPGWSIPCEGTDILDMDYEDFKSMCELVFTMFIESAEYSVNLVEKANEPTCFF